MAVTVVGSVAFDAVETPSGNRGRILGGAATHFSLAASFFTQVRVVGIVGDDFGEEELSVFEARGINTDDLERIEEGKSFFWSGRYEGDMQVAQTLETDLNVFGQFDPSLSHGARTSNIVFLANIQPDVQYRVREQCSGALFSGLDSMNYWIDSARPSLVKTLGTVDLVVLNDAEVRSLTGEPNLARSARMLRSMGPKIIVVKQGLYGACLCTEDGFFFVPGYPLDRVVDPTGAGDAFAGGLFGYLDCHVEDGLSEGVLRCAMVYGSVLASFSIEAFGTERLQSLTREEIEQRFHDFKRMTHFEVQPLLTGAAR